MDKVTAAQAAVLSGFSERTIRRKIASGELQAQRLAANRYAIKMSDLPIHPRGADFAHRLEVLEQRVRLLEQIVTHALAATPTKDVSTEVSKDASPAAEAGGAAGGAGSLVTIEELVARLAQETARLAPQAQDASQLHVVEPQGQPSAEDNA
jgi:hypothetical protein